MKEKYPAACQRLMLTVVVVQFWKSYVTIAVDYEKIPCPLVFAAGVQCTASSFRDDPRRMLRIIQSFGKH
jgi:hypothetical protein